MSYLIFSLTTLILIVFIGIYISRRPNEVCTYCLNKFKNVKQIHDQVSLCDEHYELYIKSDLSSFLCVKCNSVQDENGIYLYELSQSLKKANRYNHIISEYDIVDDQIITIQTLYCEPFLNLQI